MVSSCSSISFTLSVILLMRHGHFSKADKTEDFKRDLKERAFKRRSDTNEELCKPRHVHISFGNKIVDMKIMWATPEKCENCEVSYGVDPWSMDKKARSRYTHFVERNKKGFQHLYLSELQDLHPNTTYFYTPECASQRKGPFYFHVPPVDEDWVAEYLVFGDMGIQSQTVQTVIKEAQSGRYTAVVHAGDFAYNFYDKGGLVGDKFMEMIEPAASFLPYMTSPGNHEIDEDTFSHYCHRFAMPDSDWPMPLDKMWYSMDIGLVHFISYSSEVFFTNDRKYVEVQKKWLLNDLAMANNRRNVTPWVIAYGHRPLYCSTRIGDDCSQDPSNVRDGLEKIFYDSKVDLILQAHEHNYERLWPLFRGTITDFSYENVSAPIQIITGAAGSHYKTDHFVKGDKPSWSAFRIDEAALNSYGRLVVENRTHIWWEQRLALDHTPIDGIWIIKDDMFKWNTDISFVSTNRRGHWLAAGVLGLCLSVVIIAFFIRFIVKARRKKKFLETWHAPTVQDVDEEGEVEEFSQNTYRTSLI